VFGGIPEIPSNPLREYGRKSHDEALGNDLQAWWK